MLVRKCDCIYAHLTSPQQLCPHPTPFSHTLVSCLLHSAGVGGGPEIQGAGAEALGPLLGGQLQTSHLESTHEAECPLPYLVCIHSTHRWLRVSIEWDLEYFFPGMLQVGALGFPPHPAHGLTPISSFPW